MDSVLVSWIGHTDLRASRGEERVGLGPLAQAVDWEQFSRIELLSDYSSEDTGSYVRWLGQRTTSPIHIHPVGLSSPTAFGEIYTHAKAVVDQIESTGLTFHLSPGTPAMAAVWIILGKTRHSARLIESSFRHGVRVASVPFDLAADFVPDLLAARDARARKAAAAEPPEAPEFSDIKHRSPVMGRVIERARRIAASDVPVLIEGESGTGKELFARAIHRASRSASGPFVAVNCGAIPEHLVESELFGHKKGAFTGAAANRKGHFREAHGGTLFLDEIGELPADAQVKLLRSLQEGEVTPVGASRPETVQVRIIAATNRNLLTEVRQGRFRNDLFYRLAVAILLLPPLREREGDVGLLLDHLLESLNKVWADDPVLGNKVLGASARNLALQHPWPGNVRELENTLHRAALWSSGPVIDEDDLREALLPSADGVEGGVLGKPLGPPLDLRDLMAHVATHYLSRAWADSGQNKTRAAELVGLPSYQTFSNWMEKYGVE